MCMFCYNETCKVDFCFVFVFHIISFSYFLLFYVRILNTTGGVGTMSCTESNVIAKHQKASIVCSMMTQKSSVGLEITQ